MMALLVGVVAVVVEVVASRAVVAEVEASHVAVEAIHAVRVQAVSRAAAPLLVVAFRPGGRRQPRARRHSNRRNGSNVPQPSSSLRNASNVPQPSSSLPVARQGTCLTGRHSGSNR